METKEFLFKENQKVRVVNVNNEDKQIWFIAKDVCDILNISNNRQAIQKLDDDEKLMSVLHTSGQKRDTWCINEFGLYSLILSSNKPEAKAFKKWVTSEVLPSIRLTGGYNNQRFVARENKIQSIVSEIDEIEEEITEVKERLTMLNKRSKTKNDELRVVLKTDMNQLTIF